MGHEVPCKAKTPRPPPPQISSFIVHVMISIL